MKEQILTTSAVKEIALDCVIKPSPSEEVMNEVKEEVNKADDDKQAIIYKNMVAVRGLTSTYVFDYDKVMQHKDELRTLLGELPPQFRKRVGGGWSFLMACETKDGVQWADHPQMEMLFVLSIAAGLAEYQTGRELWFMFPGGVPYIMVTAEYDDDMELKEKLDEEKRKGEENAEGKSN